MKLIKSIAKMSSYISRIKQTGKSVGFVPTMGYLHDGHLSIIKKAAKETDRVIVSIFVNPTQFGPKEDFCAYPRDINRDIKVAKRAGCDVVFNPSEAQMYPEGFDTYVNVEQLSQGLCGRFRPGHFKGVATVVVKLFNIVKPDIAYFGQKDYQQAIIIKRMSEDLNIGVKIKVSPIVREQDGLALSSRNIYLSPSERKDAIILYQALKHAKGLIATGERSCDRIIKAIRTLVIKKATRIDYISVVDAYTLEQKNILSGDVVIALAAWFGKTRLIDNVLVKNIC